MVLSPVSLIGIAQPHVLAVDNGGTNTRVSWRHGDTTLTTESYPTPQDYELAISTLDHYAENMCVGQKVDAVGFAIAGEVKDNKIIRAGQLQAYGWCEKAFGEDVAQSLKIEIGKVVLMNDCVAAAKAQQTYNRKSRGPVTGYVETISTGLGGAGFDGHTLIPDEPGHEMLRPGEICGCGRDGCVEAYISGSGIERRFGVPSKDLTINQWHQVGADAADAHETMLERFIAKGFEPEAFYFFGSVALKSPNILMHIRTGLISSKLRYKPEVLLATHGDDSGLVGAGDAAVEIA